LEPLKVETRRLNNFMDTKNLENKIEKMIIIELVKAGASRDQVREVLGTLNNNEFAKINPIFNPKSKK
jgi:hypothetical protein